MEVERVLKNNVFVSFGVYFQTTHNFQFRFNEWLTGGHELLRHSGDKICPLGHAAAWVFALQLVLRVVIPNFQSTKHTIGLLTLFTLGGLWCIYFLCGWPFFFPNMLFRIGVDEAGRGCFAGIVSVGGCCFYAPEALQAVNDLSVRDSKKIKSETEREEIATELFSMMYHERFLIVQVDYATPETIMLENNISTTVNRLWNQVIQRIIRVVMEREREEPPTFEVIVDGSYFRLLPDIVTDHAAITTITCLPKADATVLEVSVASILAKVEHDSDIDNQCAEHPDWDEQYGLLKNKGYGTAAHRKGIEDFGYCSIHRRNFKI